MTLGSLLLPPVVGALGADEYEVHAVLSGVHKRDSLVVAALLALQVLPPGQRRVLHALLVHLEEELGAFPGGSRGTSSRLVVLVRTVHTVIRLVPWLSLLKVATDAAVVNEPTDVLVVRSLLLLRLQHVVALSAKAHTLKRCHLAEK